MTDGGLQPPSVYCQNMCSYVSKIMERTDEQQAASRAALSRHPTVYTDAFPGSTDPIIPSYYLTDLRPGQILQIDYYSTIQDSIRNLRKLTPYQLEYLKGATDAEKYELICLYDSVFYTYDFTSK